MAPIPKTPRRKGVRLSYVCKFEACSKPFNPATKTNKFCSDECRRSSEILEWAPRLLEMRKEGKTHREIGREFGISKGAAIQRAARLNGAQNGHGKSYSRLAAVSALIIPYRKD